MTTPAINVNDSLAALNKGNRIRKNALGVVTQITPLSTSYYRSLVTRVRPESSSSPIRSDGSRAPKAWEHRWSSIVFGHGQLTVKGPYLGGTYEFVFDDWFGNGPVYQQLITQVGLTWVNGNDVSTFPQSAENAARTKVLNKALAGQADLGVTLGELSKTVGFLGDLCRGIEDVFRKAADKPYLLDGHRRHSGSRKQKLGRVRDILYNLRQPSRKQRESAAAYKRRLRAERQVVDDWMSYQFAVKPLVADLEKAAGATAWWLWERNNPLRLTVKAGGESRDEGHAEQVFTFSAGHAAVARVLTVAVAQCHFSLTYDVEPGIDRTLQQLGLTNPLSVAHELIRASWLIDYAVGVGDWIKSMTKLDGMNFVEGSRSRIVRLTGRDAAVQFRPSGNSTSASGKATCALNIGRFSRTVLTSTPLPGWSPSVKKAIGLTQIANSLGFVAGISRGNLRI